MNTWMQLSTQKTVPWAIYLLVKTAWS